jgi:hypothetical protein
LRQVKKFRPKKNTHSPIRSVDRQEVSSQTSQKGFGNDNIQKMFVSKLADSDGEAAETQVWLDFARDCGYMLPARRDELVKGYEEVGKMLGNMISAPEKFIPRYQRRE